MQFFRCWAKQPGLEAKKIPADASAGISACGLLELDGSRLFEARVTLEAAPCDLF